MADMAVAALLQDGHRVRAYEITGPGHISPAQRAAVIAQALGREITFVPLTPAEARQLWISQGVPPEVCDWLLWESDPEDEGAGWAPGEFVSKDYERVMGHAGRTYARWVADHLDAFRWHPAGEGGHRAPCAPPTAPGILPTPAGRATQSSGHGPRPAELAPWHEPAAVPQREQEQWKKEDSERRTHHTPHRRAGGNVPPRG